MMLQILRVILITIRCLRAEGKKFHSGFSKWIWLITNCFSKHLFCKRMGRWGYPDFQVFFKFEGNLSISIMFCLSVHEAHVHGQNDFQTNSKWIMEHLFDERMSDWGYPLISFLYMTKGDLLITRLFYLRVMVIAEYFPNKSQMNYETPLIFKNDSYRGALAFWGEVNNWGYSHSGKIVTNHETPILIFKIVH